MAKRFRSHSTDNKSPVIRLLGLIIMTIFLLAVLYVLSKMLVN
ncbi:hypothetical protein TetV_341 [Tetraselmis virus 1]|uniref:Uncharacterized protein n=1 Tax=Tetraselmis virus 1 TaxID=2060617 RepID=A0A2P0VNF8_9VIRU|nr:hypothetical protein QJ968_gp341 [Tetraselmis virus 1]AUF82433.1 hypothetical protein TetV_341 [Tetraselmis virus 1]